MCESTHKHGCIVDNKQDNKDNTQDNKDNKQDNKGKQDNKDNKQDNKGNKQDNKDNKQDNKDKDNKQIQNSAVLMFKRPNNVFLQEPEKQNPNFWTIIFVLESVVVTMHDAIFNIKTLSFVHRVYLLSQ